MQIKKILLKMRARFFEWLHRPRMLNNVYFNKGARLAKNTRYSSTVDFVNKIGIKLGDNVYIGHYVTLDGSATIDIAEGCQISSKVSILTHSSHVSIRLFGKKYNLCKGRVEDGYVLGKVTIGKYTFIGTNSIIAPNVTIGKGCIVGANSFVNSDLEDYAIAYGTPAKIVGVTRAMDKKFLQNNEKFTTYYNEWNNE